ncbi:MAG: glycine--tRNA ligase subunit beta [Tissierellia bacterium]|nr:glycine--tRNA ligase subunit beta [Tissierellia bacterium]
MDKYLLEIGVEEFPAKYIKSTQQQIVSGMKKLLEENKYEYKEIKINSTPRRFALLVDGISANSEGTTEKVKGPAKKIALDENGEPSKALSGFLKSKGLSKEDIYFEELNGVEYVFTNLVHEVEKIENVLSQGVPSMISNITNPRAMRWGGKNIRFLRPIRWIVSILNDEVLDFDLEGISVGNITKGHRTLGSSQIVIDKIENYEKLLEENYVIVDEEKRKSIITRGVNRLAKEKGGNYVHDEDLLEEIVQINEYPTTFIGSFDTEYLKLPKEVIVTPMKDHQRYFPIENDQKQLLPYFISVRNGDKKGIENVVKGNEKVLVARLEDAKFFYEQDIQIPFEEYTKQLDSLGFHDGLGNMAQKSNRLKKLVKSLGEQLNISEDIIEHARRAAELSKADLVTKSVIEFTELQGTMGKIYSHISGENKMVSLAIEEQYMPRHAGASLPQTTAGILLSLADKIDTIAGLHSVDIVVTGSQDPYGQRRSALGILNILIDHKMNLDLEIIVKDALFNYVEDFGQNFDYEQVTKTILEFITQRFRNKMIDENHKFDIVDSIIGQDKKDYCEMFEKIKAVEDFFGREDIQDVLTRFVRVKNISKNADTLEVDEQVLNEDDKKIYALKVDLELIDRKINVHNYSKALSRLANLTVEVDNYLDNTMINADDEALKQSRLALIKNISLRVENIFNPTTIVRS